VAALFLRDKGARVTVSDSRSAVALEKEIPALLDAGIMVEAGGHGLLTFRRQDLIVVSPGVPYDTPELKQVRAFGLPDYRRAGAGEPLPAGQGRGDYRIEWQDDDDFPAGQDLCGCGRADAGGREHWDAGDRVGGGKHRLSRRRDEQAGPSTSAGPAQMPHQLRMTSSVEGAKEVWSVLEVSSFQLETVEEFHPQIAVVLNITPDHLDRHGTFENYAAMKTRITARQTPEDFLVLNGEDPPTQMVAAKTRAQVFWFSGRRPIKQGAFVHGESVLFIPREGAKAEPVTAGGGDSAEGRAQRGECAGGGVRGAAGRGLRRSRFARRWRASRRSSIGWSLWRGARRGVLQRLQGDQCGCDEEGAGGVCGRRPPDPRRQGQELGLRGVERFAARAVQIVYTIGSAAEKIERQLAGVVKIVSAGTLDAAVRKAAQDAVAGDVVLLAPACSSFDQFENYEQRGRVFKELVRQL
jgi:UDP-N-acetylmuramoylalanine--D-glutamate ligase